MLDAPHFQSQFLSAGSLFERRDSWDERAHGYQIRLRSLTAGLIKSQASWIDVPIFRSLGYPVDCEGISHPNDDWPYMLRCVLAPA